MEIDFNKLKQQYPDYHGVIEGYEESLKRLNLFKDLRKHAAVEILLQNFRNEIDYINNVLLFNINITDQDRRYLFAKRENAQFMIDLFTGLDSQEKTITESIQNLEAGK